MDSIAPVLLAPYTLRGNFVVVELVFLRSSTLKRCHPIFPKDKGVLQLKLTPQRTNYHLNLPTIVTGNLLLVGVITDFAGKEAFDGISSKTLSVEQLSLFVSREQQMT